MILVDIALVIAYAIIFSWAVNVQVLAMHEKNKKDKTLAIVLAVIAALLLGVISRV
jgi:uncharacterized membrane protein